LIATARKVGAPADIAEATDRFNREHLLWLADQVQGYLPEEGTVGILGLTYKPNTDVVEEAVGVHLARELADRGVPVVAYDPAGNVNAQEVLGKRVRFVDSAQECIAAADVVVVATPWEAFLSLPVQAWARHNPLRVVIDCWRALKRLSGVGGIQYVPLGIFKDGGRLTC
jgi:UDPglucose 6-dehydrogenase